MAAIAVDRFTSLAQPLQYNNMITRTSVHRYIIAFWIYAFIVGFVPILYKMEKVLDYAELPQCDFSSLLDGPMQLFLFCTVFGPCALTIISKYRHFWKNFKPCRKKIDFFFRIAQKNWKIDSILSLSIFL